MNKVIVTGAGGYIGGQTVIAYSEAGWHVIGIDKHSPSQTIAGFCKKFLVSPFDSSESLALVVKEKPDVIVHCGGSSLVGPSIKDPSTYYENNFIATKHLLDTIVENKLHTRIIFSSSAATYGEPVLTPICEEDPQIPVNPYGASKLMVETLLESYQVAYGLDYISFRYFNVCGADSQCRHGQAPEATHIIARILESIISNKTFILNGVDFPTEDGTCIRDYVHVEDIARAHLLASQHAPSGCYNISTGTGNSNRQILDTAFRVTGKSVAVVEKSFRAGDPAVLVGASDKFTDATGWLPQHNLESIIQTAWAWYSRKQ